MGRGTNPLPIIVVVTEKPAIRTNGTKGRRSLKTKFVDPGEKELTKK